MKVYQQLAGSFKAYNEAVKTGNYEWREKHYDRIMDIVNNSLPHGSGIDGEVKFNFDNSKDNKLIIESSYHAMNENGYYDGWYDFKIIITPTLSSNFDIVVKGNFGKYSFCKDSILDDFYFSLNSEY